MYRERDAVGRFQKGVSATLEERKDIAARFKGSRSWLWKGGVAAPNQLLRTQVEYQIWRRAVFKRDDYTCQRCHKKGGQLNAHHKLPFADYPALRFDVSNGETVCRKCHYGVVHSRPEPVKRATLQRRRRRGYLKLLTDPERLADLRARQVISSRKWRRTHPEKRKASQKLYRQGHQRQYREIQQRYRARLKRESESNQLVARGD